MADKKITELTQATDIDTDDLFTIVKDPSGSATNQKVEFSQILDITDPIGVYHRLDTAESIDDEFDDETIDGDWTTIVPSGTTTWTETMHAMNYETINQNSSDVGGLVKAHALAVGEEIETAIQIGYRDSNYNMSGLMVLDGNTSTDTGLIFVIYPNATNGILSVGSYQGTPEAWTTNPEGDSLGGAAISSHIRAKLRRDTATTYKFYVSWNHGAVWFELANIEQTGASFTPSHVGLCASTWGNSTYEAHGRYEYFRLHT